MIILQEFIGISSFSLLLVSGLTVVEFFFSNNHRILESFFKTLYTDINVHIHIGPPIEVTLHSQIKF